MGMKRLLFVMVAILALSLAACTRSASQSTNGGTEDALPFPTPGEEGTPDMMSTLMAGGFATQTAQAQGLEPQATEEPQVATATPVPQATPTASGQAERPPAFSTATPEPAEPPSACQSPYTVQAGEWVYSIARKCGLDPNDIIAVNNLRAPYLLYPGDKLDLPEGNGQAPDEASASTCESPYTVNAGEWVYSIGRKCGVEPDAIISANNLAYPYTIYPGDRLTIP